MSASNIFVMSIPKDAFTEIELIHYIESGHIPRNAISWSAENGFTELTKKLIDLGADVRENRNYPLELASKNGHAEIVKILIDAGASTYDSESDEGYSLRMAARGGYLEIVKMLLNAGADPTANGYLALELALNNKHMDVVEILLDSICHRRMIIKIT